jgi:hypothetical protein
MRYCPDKGREFWRGISQDDGLSRYDPRKRVVDLLRDKDSVIHKRGGRGVVDVFRILSYYWNKWVAEEEVKRLPSSWPETAGFNETGWGIVGG